MTHPAPDAAAAPPRRHRGEHPSPAGRGPSDDARIRQLVADLYLPLEGSPQASRRDPRQEERELARARAAAQRAFKVRPSLSKRKAAAMILSTGALGLTAFSPPVARYASAPAGADAALGKRQSPDRLRASERLKRALMEEEGVRHTVYRDVAGYPTVGVGHLLRARDGLEPGDRISDAQARAFLDADLRLAEQSARELLGGLPVYQHEFDALVDLVYNVGGGNVGSEESPRLNEAIAAGDYEGIAAELDYTQAGGSFVRGLANRSERRANMFRLASYEDPHQRIGGDGLTRA